jgi:hypothetical protein
MAEGWDMTDKQHEKPEQARPIKRDPPKPQRYPAPPPPSDKPVVVDKTEPVIESPA